MVQKQNNINTHSDMKRRLLTTICLLSAMVAMADTAIDNAPADTLANEAARNFLNALERIPSIIDQYKAKNEVLEKEIPQLQEIAGKVWKKEDELKQLKSELAALDRKIQLELAPPTPEVTEKSETPDSVMSHINKEIKIKSRISL